MTQITEPNKCTGCQACRLKCPSKCISFVADDEGFQVPSVDDSNCTDCGLCASNCPENNRPEFTKRNCIKVLGARYRNDAILAKSASGGVFAGIASMVLETPGNAVFGCAFDENFVARHICVTDVKGITPLQSSKYVQSDVGDTYLQAKDLLDKGKTVFYTGCPCQIAGLYAFLGKDYDNLLTADLICHGVPSPLLFKRYLGWLKKKYGGEIISVNFRSKDRNGWDITGKAEIKNNSKIKVKPIISNIDPYYSSFIANRTHRLCCYTCQYANSERVADITLGDFWGIKNVHPEFYDSRGVSVVLVSTEKGAAFFEKVYKEFDIIESSFKNAAMSNHNLREPSPRRALRDDAYKGINEEATDIFKGSAYKIRKKTLVIINVKEGLKLILPRAVINMLKVVLRR